MDPLAPELPPQNEVEQLLVLAADHPDDPAAGQAFVRVLMGAHVGMPGREDDQGRFAPEIRVFGERPFVLAFTHPSRFERFLQAAGPIEGKLVVHGIAGRDLLAELVRNNMQLLLNAGNGYGKEFTVPEMSDLLAGVQPGARERVVTRETSLMVGEPAHVPDGLVGRLRDHIARVGGVTEAALAWVRYPDGLEGYLLEVSGPVLREAFLAGIDDAIGDLGGRTCDVLVSGEAGRTTTTGVPPFHTA